MTQLQLDTMITRVGWCKDCANGKRPKSDELFLVKGKRGYHVYEAFRTPTYFGFTPHLYVKIKTIGSNVVYASICSMQGCGVYLSYDHDKLKFDFYFEEKWERGIFTLSDWNSLVTYKRDLDYLI